MAKSKGGGTVAAVQALVEPVLTDMGLRLWDIRFEKEGPDYFLRIFIDRDTPLDITTVEEATRAINPIIDEADPISQSYYMEVGSPGLGRRLTKDAHYEALTGKEILCTLFRPNKNGEKEVRGVLKGKDSNGVTLITANEEVTIAASDISVCKLCDDDDLFK